MAKITRSHTFTIEINHASALSQYFNENSYRKNCLRLFFAMTGKPALDRFVIYCPLCFEPVADWTMPSFISVTKS